MDARPVRSVPSKQMTAHVVASNALTSITIMSYTSMSSSAVSLYGGLCIGGISTRAGG